MSEPALILIGILGVQLLVFVVYVACNYPVWMRDHEILLRPIDGWQQGQS